VAEKAAAGTRKAAAYRQKAAAALVQDKSGPQKADPGKHPNNVQPPTASSPPEQATLQIPQDNPQSRPASPDPSATQALKKA